VSADTPLDKKHTDLMRKRHAMRLQLESLRLQGHELESQIVMLDAELENVRGQLEARAVGEK
jgi:hypothetical protein